MNIEKEFKKFRWFFTSSGKLVVGGKSEEQNEELVKFMIDAGKEHVVMHTSSPGSPFSFIVSEINEVEGKDLEETAVFTACFSKAWKSAKSKVEVDIFRISQIFKEKGMKTGTFGVAGSESRKVELKLYLTMQEGVLRAVPFKSKLGNEIIEIIPGKIDKEKMADKIAKKTGANKEEIMQAIPAGGFKL
jgi:predicted ribosome quality control (RQC) complex YloA/Tae2 family protein